MRRKGGGRREVADLDTTLVSDLQRLAEPATMGDPIRPLKWVSKSPAKLAAALCAAGHTICANTVARLLETKLEYSRQVNRKTHDGTNTGWVSVGVTADTASFAVNSIRTWRKRMGQQRHPGMHELTITADCGGSNGARVRLWKVELQRFADETDLVLHVHHYPPGTSKWNLIEHRMFCHITQNWRGRPLSSRMAVVELIGATTTNAGLKVECALDKSIYEKGVKVTKAEMDSLVIEGNAFHPEWNYTITPRRRHQT